MYGTATTITGYGSRPSPCPWCGNRPYQRAEVTCSCSGGWTNVFTIYSSPSPARDWKREKLEENAFRRDMHQLSIDMGRDYSLREEPRPPVHEGRTSTSFHWTCHRRRGVKMRASRPGWDRGR
jgi:hypothetical protein